MRQKANREGFGEIRWVDSIRRKTVLSRRRIDIVQLGDLELLGWDKMPRVVPDQKEKFDRDELFRKLSRETEVGLRHR